MNIKEFINTLEQIRAKYGDDIEVCKLKHGNYLSKIFKEQIVYDKMENKIEI